MRSKYAQQFILSCLLCLSLQVLRAQSTAAKQLEGAFEQQVEQFLAVRNSDAPQALVHTDSALYLAEKLASDSLIAKALRYRSFALRGLGRWQAALSSLHQGFRLHPQNSTEDSMRYHNSLANIYNIQGIRERALHHYERALSAAQRLNQYKPISGIQLNLAVLNANRKAYRKALPFFYQALHYLPKNNEALRIHIYYNLAEVHRFLGQPDSALFYINVLQSQIEEGRAPEAVVAYVEFLRANIKKDAKASWREVQKHGLTALKLIKDLGDPAKDLELRLYWIEILLDYQKEEEADSLLQALQEAAYKEWRISDSINWLQLKVRLDSTQGDWQSASSAQAKLLQLEEQAFERENKRYEEAVRAEYLDASSAQAAAQRRALLNMKKNLLRNERISRGLIALLLALGSLLIVFLLRWLRLRALENKILQKTVEEQTAAVVQRNEQLQSYAYLNSNKLGLSLYGILELLTKLENGTDDEEQLNDRLHEAGVEMDAVIREINEQLDLDEKAGKKVL